nr:manganese efflux pump MntP family protein [uncultured Negativibacillus sp.]
MYLLNLLMIAVGLSMDAFAVSMTNGMCISGHCNKNRFFGHAFVWSAMFGLFQGLMPLLGYFLGRTFSALISSFDHWVAFLLLAFIGGKMVWEAIHPEEEECDVNLPFGTIVTQAVATSIDALAVGVSFALLQVEIFSASGIIALTTLLLSLAASFLGKGFGSLLKSKAEVFGGVILILIGVKILLEHTLLA